MPTLIVRGTDRMEIEMSKVLNSVGDLMYNVTTEVEKLAAAIIAVAFGLIAAIAVTGAVTVLFPAVGYYFLLAIIPVGVAVAYTKIRR